jgi:phosphoglycerate dehydrogenase-like enzyme
MSGDNPGSTRVAVLDDWQKVAHEMADWDSLGSNIEAEFFTDPIPRDELKTTLSPYHIICLMRERTPFPGSLIRELPNLRYLITSGARNASIDVASAKECGVPVSGTESGQRGTVELATGLMLMLARGLHTQSRSMTDGGWQVGLGRELSGARLGVLGLGRLGSQVAKMGHAFGMEVQAWSQNLTNDRCEEHGVSYADKEAFFKTSDFITIHLKLSDRVRALVGKAELSLMKDDAFLINTSRAPIVDTHALVEALESHQIAGAALDVYDVEPLPADDPLRTTPNLLLTPHVGYVTRETYHLFFPQMVENIAAFLKGQPIRLIE